MKPSPVADDEAERLRAVRWFGDLDALTDESLDALARVAATLCNVPVALVTLLDDHRVRFIAQVGLDEVHELPRDVAFCAHTIMGEELLVVNDARLDERFRDYPCVTGAPGLRFYAGAPLVDEEGYAVGTMCVADTEPRTLSSEARAALRDLTRTVMRILATRRGARALETNMLRGAASLREKETLIKEIHHRVKNNLQVVASLLNIHGRSVEDERVRTIFTDVRGRIQSIALLHERLYRSRDLGHIDVADYLHDVAIDAARAAGGQQTNMVFSLESLPIDIDTALPLGLIVNELVTNAFKHGMLSASSRALVTISLTATHGVITLSVTDSGPGFPPGFHLEDATSMGMLLLRSLARQIHGSVRVLRKDDETRLSLSFSHAAAQASAA